MFGVNGSSGGARQDMEALGCELLKVSFPIPALFCECTRDGLRVLSGKMIVLLLFLQKQNLANAIYLFRLGTLLLHY